MDDHGRYPVNEEPLTEHIDNVPMDSPLPHAIKSELAERPPLRRICLDTADRLENLGLSQSEYNSLVDSGYTLSRLECLQGILLKKLGGVPPNGFPVLRIANIIFESDNTHISNVPPDLSLTWFLENRKAVADFGDTASKDEGQDIKITRAIYFYRLDDKHQLFRHHDHARWNITIFLALLAQDDKIHERKRQKEVYEARRLRAHEHRMQYDPEYRYIIRKYGFEETDDIEEGELYQLVLDAPLPHRARAFMLSYLSAILESHNNPSAFTARNTFISEWKESPYELLFLKSGPAKRMKQEMIRLRNEWTTEVRTTIEDVNGHPHRFDDEIGKFVGVFISRPKQYYIDEKKQRKERRALGDKKSIQVREDRKVKGGPNRLLQALEANWGHDVEKPPRRKRVDLDEDYGRSKTVVDARTAIKAVEKTSGAEMVGVMRRYFG